MIKAKQNELEAYRANQIDERGIERLREALASVPPLPTECTQATLASIVAGYADTPALYQSSLWQYVTYIRTNYGQEALDIVLGIIAEDSPKLAETCEKAKVMQ